MQEKCTKIPVFSRKGGYLKQVVLYIENLQVQMAKTRL